MQEKTKKRWKIAGYVIIGIILVYMVIAVLPRPQNFKDANPNLKGDSLPILVAHRGGAEEFPGDTLEAFYNAYSVDENAVLETDVSITKDGVVILCHDVRLDRTTNVTGEIKDWTYVDLKEQKVNFGYYNETEDQVLVEGSELQIYKDYNGKEVKPFDLPGYEGEGLPGRDKDVYLVSTLEELIKAFPENRISVEIKQDGEWGEKALKESLRIIKEQDAFNRVNLASFHEDISKLFKKYVKDGLVPDNFMYSPSVSGVIKYYALKLFGLDVFYGENISILQIPMEEYGFDLSTKNLIKNAHAHNIAVHYWTIDDADDMRELIEIGADGIMTDRPHLLKQVLSEYETK